ncbi:hypothetical protein [Tropicibacter naphthalenivorans]|uniref:Uncharacterized protein n=1 Tax=Tropicibacter naphthalenivorans TaxID=441103 RepID=A0A0P1GKX4_9RHOB|nr:hypothetical protein [Tropicibacter naphthalenivorans]CUH82634.1 hypothetical protein TRN7648_04176 [Tropicibacter naphthalenivorans]SMD09016.1 hypothetical protein SAMN04488093_11825 [Tropicibacter naphthalenivorans]
MRLILSPTRSDAKLRLKRQGDSLIVNGKAHDFADLAIGQSRPAAGLGDWCAADPYRDADGTLVLTVRLPHGAKASKKRLYPSPIEVTKDGAIRLPR